MKVYNPNGVDVSELPRIFGFNNGENDYGAVGQLVAESGHGLGGHLCSDEGYMSYDLGCSEGSRPDRDKDFKEHYPDGYVVEFVPTEGREMHVGFFMAVQNARKLGARRS